MLGSARSRDERRARMSQAEALAAAAWSALDGDVVRGHYPPDATTPALARNLVFDACLAWDRADLAYRAREVISELATNAVMHAGTTLEVWALRRGEEILVAVGDGVPQAQSIDGRHDVSQCDGLRIVDRLACGWGCVPSEHGKLIWAMLR